MTANRPSVSSAPFVRPAPAQAPPKKLIVTWVLITALSNLVVYMLSISKITPHDENVVNIRPGYSLVWVEGKNYAPATKGIIVQLIHHKLKRHYTTATLYDWNEEQSSWLVEVPLKAIDALTQSDFTVRLIPGQKLSNQKSKRSSHELIF